MRAVIFIMVLIFSGCSNKPVPQWQSSAKSYIKKMEYAKLAGFEKEAKIYKNSAIEQIKMSASIAKLQILELTDIALDVALLKTADFSSYDRLEAIEFVAENRAFRDFLAGQNTDISMLDSRYSSFAKDSTLSSAKKIEDELSRLIALAILAKNDRENVEIYNSILEISKPNGYLAVSINTLSVLRAIYTKNQDIKNQREIELLLEELKR